MSVEWQQAKRIFNAALEQSGDERAAYLDDACGSNVELRREVHSLLSAFEADKSFLNNPAIEDLDLPTRQLNSGLTPGQAIGHYTILRHLGSGGMGQVYLARDPKLD